MSAHRKVGEKKRPVRTAQERRVTPSLVLLCLVALVLFAWPAFMLIVGAFRTAPPGLGGHWTTSAIGRVLGSGVTWHAFANSVLLTLGIVTISTGLALYLAWTVTRTRTPLRRIVTPVMVLVFLVPPFFFALSWAMLGLRPVGLVDSFLSLLIGARSFTSESWYGMIAVGVMGATAPQYLLLLGPVGAVDRSLEEAAVLAGASRLKAFCRIEIPMLGPAILGVVVLGFVFGLGFLPIPLLLGQPASIQLLPTQVYDYVAGTTPPDFAGGSVIALLLVVATSGLVVAQWRLLKRRSFTTVTGKSGGGELLDLGKWRWFGSSVIVLYAGLALVLPFGQYVIGSFEPYFGVYSHLGLGNYRALLSSSTVLHSLGTTIMVAVVGGFAASGLAVWIAVTARQGSSWLRRLPELSVWMLLAVPGITLGLGFVWAYLSVPGLKDLYGTQWIVLIALLVGSTPIASRAVEGSVAQISRELEEAARVAGASRLRTLVGILVRLVLPSFTAGWFLAGVVAAGNIDVPILLSSPGNQTVAIVANNLFDNGNSAQAAALFCVVALGATGALLVSSLLRWGWKTWYAHIIQRAERCIELPSEPTALRRLASRASVPPGASSGADGSRAEIVVVQGRTEQ